MGQSFYKVDSSKMRDQISKRGIKSLSAMSVELGFADSYINHVLSRGTIAKPAAMLIERCYGIKPEDYQPVEKPALEKAQVNTNEDKKDNNRYINIVDYDKLYNVIYKAVYNAITDS